MLAFIRFLTGNRPDNSLPDMDGDGYPDNSLPGGRPDRPDNSLPYPPLYPDQGLPDPVLPTVPVFPEQLPGKPVVAPPGSVWPPLPPVLNKKFLVVVLIPGVGRRWTVIDPNLRPATGLPGAQPK